jgi:hypothetical protein
MDTALGVVGVAFAASCIWLTVRAVNRRHPHVNAQYGFDWWLAIRVLVYFGLFVTFLRLLFLNIH